MKIYPENIPPHPLAIPASFRKEDLFNTTFSSGESYLTFHKSINKLSHKYLEDLSERCHSQSFGSITEWLGVNSGPKSNTHQIQDTKVKIDYFYDRDWIAEEIKKRRSSIVTNWDLTQSETAFLNGEDKFIFDYDDENEKTIGEALMVKLLALLSQEYYGDFNFNIACQSNRTFNYFEFQDPTLKSFKDITSQVSLGDAFYYRTYYLEILPSAVQDSDNYIVVPIIYNNPLLTNEGFDMNFDLIAMKANFKFRYVNYDAEHKLVLGYFDPEIHNEEFLMLPKGKEDRTRRRIRRRTSAFFFYLPWKYVGVRFRNPLGIDRQLVLPFEDPQFEEPDFILNYEVDNGCISGITKSEIMKVIKKSGLKINKHEFPITHDVITSKYTSGFYNVDKEFYNLQQYNLKHRPKTLFTYTEYWKFKNLFVELSFRRDELAEEKITSYLKKAKSLKPPESHQQEEWQKICSYLGGQYKLEQLRQIAQNKFSITKEKLDKLSKRALCALLAKKTLLTQQKASQKWLSIHRGDSKYPIPKPDKICDNYTKTPDIEIDFNDISKKLYNPETKQITDNDKAELIEFFMQALRKSYDELDEIGNEDLAAWKGLFKQWEETIHPFNEMKSKDFIVIVKPDLTSSCVGIDTVKKAPNQGLCLWTLTPGKDPDDVGHHYQPTQDVYGDKIIPLPFIDPELEDVTDIVPNIFIRLPDWSRIMDNIGKNNHSNKLLIFYLGTPIQSRTGNCGGTYGVSQLHAQRHSEKAIYPVVYKRRIKREKYISSKKSEAEQKLSPEQQKIKSELEEINREQAKAARDLADIRTELKDSFTAFEYERDYYNDDMEAYFKDKRPDKLEDYEKYNTLERENRELARKKMELTKKLRALK